MRYECGYLTDVTYQPFLPQSLKFLPAQTLQMFHHTAPEHSTVLQYITAQYSNTLLKSTPIHHCTVL